VEKRNPRGKEWPESDRAAATTQNTGTLHGGWGAPAAHRQRTGRVQRIEGAAVMQEQGRRLCAREEIARQRDEAERLPGSAARANEATLGGADWCRIDARRFLTQAWECDSGAGQRQSGEGEGSIRPFVFARVKRAGQAVAQKVAVAARRAEARSCRLKALLAVMHHGRGRPPDGRLASNCSCQAPARPYMNMACASLDSRAGARAYCACAEGRES
jgi:hypothetical protein